MKKTAFLAMPIALIALTACNSLNEHLTSRSETVEIYHIYDVQTTVDTATIAKAAAAGISQNTNSIRTALPLQLNKTLPAQAGRFTLEDLGAKFGNIPGLSIMKRANCSDAVWTAVAKRTTAGASDLTLYACLYKYRSGYNLDLYAMFEKQSGIAQLPNAMAEKLVGTAEEWVSKTIVDTAREIARVPSTRVIHLEGQPDLGPLPSVDQLGRN